MRRDRTIHRSAVTGKLVTAEYAQAHPRETVRERQRESPMAKAAKKAAKKTAKKAAKKTATKAAPKAKVKKPAKAGAGAIAAFAKDFVGDVPIEAAGGSYGATVRDRWHGKTFDIADGGHVADGWFFRFRGGRFIKATRV